MEKVSSWVHIISELSTYANSQPHTAYSAFTKGLFSKWNFLTRTIPSISHLLQPLEEVISQKFIPSVTVVVLLIVMKQIYYHFPLVWEV